ncbi:MAG: methylenetetrahydrofolate reductase C-terminal domain-containing protein [Chloroflexi bacterium]|nr:methylenetetrahydrofolate reductase C-terminal domain-containing protein [Chloroflexota bacterium]
MIVTEQKKFEEVLDSLEGHNKIFIVGCGSCATAWHTGGETEVKEMAARLEDQGKQITGWVVVDEPCDERKSKKELSRTYRQQVADSDALLVMSCGAGVQTVALSGVNKPVYPALNSLYLARVERLSKSDERCILCGDCVLAWTGGICPVTICPKGLLNGPCGGSQDGRCEVDATKECAWVAIYERLQALGQEEKLLVYRSPKNYSKMIHPRRVEKKAAVPA